MPTRYVRLGEIDLFDILTAPITFSGGIFEVKQEGISSLETGAYEGAPKGTSAKFEVTIWDELRAAEFRAYCVANRKEVDLRFFTRDRGWYYRIWGISIEPGKAQEGPMGYLMYRYNVTCYLWSPFTYAVIGTLWNGSNLSLPQSSPAMSNLVGHYSSSFESLAVTCYYDSGHVKALTLANAAGDSCVLVTESLSSEVWELQANKYRLLETYEDPITSATIWDRDTVGDGTFDTDHIRLNNLEKAYYVLSGPHKSLYPVVMTADLSLDSGGATGKALIETSEDGLSWETALDQADFVSGVYEYTLKNTNNLGDIYVRFNCNSGTSGKYLKIGSVKFEVDRRIELDIIPEVEPGESSVFTLSCNEASGDLVSIDGIFRARRLHD